MLIKQHEVIKSLKRELDAVKVAIPEQDLEKVIDLYERIILTSSGNDDNTSYTSAYIDPNASIDFYTIEEEGINSIKQFIRGIDDLTIEHPECYYPLTKDTLDTLLQANNVIIVFNRIQSVMHYIGAMAMQFLKDTAKSSPNAIWTFESLPERGSLEITAYNTEAGPVFHYMNSCLGSKRLKAD